MLQVTGIAENLKRCDFFFPKLHFSRDKVNILTSRRDWEVDGSHGGLPEGPSISGLAGRSSSDRWVTDRWQGEGSRGPEGTVQPSSWGDVPPLTLSTWSLGSLQGETTASRCSIWGDLSFQAGIARNRVFKSGAVLGAQEGCGVRLQSLWVWE